MRRILAMAALLALAAGATRPLGAQTNEAPRISDFSMPTYNEDGVLTSKLFGEFARLRPDGLVEITNLKMEFYTYADTNRVTEMRVTSPKCYYHREKGMAASDAPVRIARDNMVVTGEGFTWNGRDEHLQILKNSKVVLKGMSGKMKAGD